MWALIYLYLYGGITMKRAIAFLAAVAVYVVCSTVYAAGTVIDKGTWPESWPKELEPLREQSRTFIGGLARYEHYAIRFTKREEFESAWPYIVKVKSKGAPIFLVRGPNFFLGHDSKAGVVVHCPPSGRNDKPAGPEAQIPGVTNERMRWINKTFVELVTDGEIANLDRISLPADTPIIDERDGESPKSALVRGSHGQESRAATWQRRIDAAPHPDFGADDGGIISSLYDFQSHGQVQDLHRCQIHMVYDPNKFEQMTIKFVREGKEIIALEGYLSSVFRAEGNTLYSAEFSPDTNGCALVAYDLSTGRKLWRSDLQGIGAVEHSKYSNRVTMKIEGDVICVRGYESQGDYIEIVDSKTGKTIAHREFAPRTRGNEKRSDQPHDK
jgi:hypothetical protein